MEISEIYRGWELRWTGWKSAKSIYKANLVQPDDLCFVCHKPIADGDEVQRFQNEEVVRHWKCFGEPDFLFGQWLGWYRGKPDVPAKYIYVNAGRGADENYKRGSSFNIDDHAERTVIAGQTPISRQEDLKAQALKRLKKMIDQEEEHPSGFWDKQRSA